MVTNVTLDLTQNRTRSIDEGSALSTVPSNTNYILSQTGTNSIQGHILVVAAVVDANFYAKRAIASCRTRYGNVGTNESKYHAKDSQGRRDHHLD